MGTDIHLIAEKRTEHGWEVVPGPVVACHMCEPPRIPRPKCYYCHGTGKHHDEWYSARHYLTFSVLADVRNGYGFAGVQTYSPVTPIAPPRGLPADISDDARDWLDDREDHSASWLTLDEIEAYDWDQEVVWQNRTVEREPDRVVLREAASELLARMAQLRAATAGHEVRIVFNFDS